MLKSLQSPVSGITIATSLNLSIFLATSDSIFISTTLLGYIIVPELLRQQFNTRLSNGEEETEAEGGNTIVPEQLPAYLSAPEWQKHHAALVALAQIGCSKIIHTDGYTCSSDGPQPFLVYQKRTRKLRDPAAPTN